MAKQSEIISIAKTIKEYFKKNKKYPKSVLINGETYNIQQATYLMAAFVAKPQAEIKKKNVGGAPDPHGDRVNRECNKNTYQDMSKRLVQYINQNGRLPNYITIRDKQQCSIILFMYQLSKVVSAYKDNKLPDSVLINSDDLVTKPKVVIKKYGRSTSNGCDNRGQNNSYYCGPHMVQEIIRNLTGKVIPQSELAAVIGTTSAGSSHQGINTAFAWFNQKFNYQLNVEWKNFSEIGWNGLNKILQSNNQDCGIHELYRNEWGHYTNFDAVYNNTIDVHNSLGNSCNNGCYCGYTENRSKSEAESYLSGITQKSVLIVTRTK